MEMDRPSIAFAKFLDGIVMDGTGEPDMLVMACSLCGQGVCTVDPNDTLRVLLNTALAHDC